MVQSTGLEVRCSVVDRRHNGGRLICATGRPAPDPWSPIFAADPQNDLLRGRLINIEGAAQLDYYTYIDHEYTYSAMKAKLTITVDEKLIPEAKRHARSRGQSLSQLVEDRLRQAIAEHDAGFARRWRGRFRAAHGDDDRFAQLAKKYLDS